MAFTMTVRPVLSLPLLRLVPSGLTCLLFPRLYLCHFSIPFFIRLSLWALCITNNLSKEWDCVSPVLPSHTTSLLDPLDIPLNGQDSRISMLFAWSGRKLELINQYESYVVLSQNHIIFITPQAGSGQHWFLALIQLTDKLFLPCDSHRGEP